MGDHRGPFIFWGGDVSNVRIDAPGCQPPGRVIENFVSGVATK
jgi:hypothetical protein